jgi:hypothetical protein
MLLFIDGEYRRLASERALPTIAPPGGNPRRGAWLPIWHAQQDGWMLTAMFSRTARAHRLGQTRDWVVIYCEHDGKESHFTVVTETHGPLAGRRVVRGREAECAEHYGEAFVDPGQLHSWASRLAVT